MLLFLIGESLGMQELILIGVIALIIFGPRKLPQIARKIGKTMAEFRKATNEFRSTWEKEVDFESIEADDRPPATTNSISKTSPAVALPEVRALEESDFGKLAIKSQSAPTEEPEETIKEGTVEPQESKRDWL